MKFLNADLYNLLLDNISEGPRYVEGILEKISDANRHSYSSLQDRYIGYMEILAENYRKTKMSKIWSVYFLLGYVTNQTAKNFLEEDVKVDLLKKSYVWYKAFLSTGRGNGDTRYFAGWQSGVIQEAIGCSWPVVEETYLETVELDTLRGEALKSILHHYYTEHEWRIAHIYSAYSMVNFLGKNPGSDHKWQVEAPFYNWQVLDYHLPICLALRRKEEARMTLGKLLAYINSSPLDMSQEDILRIRQYSVSLPPNGIDNTGKLVSVKNYNEDSKSHHEAISTQFHL